MRKAAFEVALNDDGSGAEGDAGVAEAVQKSGGGSRLVGSHLGDQARIAVVVARIYSNLGAGGRTIESGLTPEPRSPAGSNLVKTGPPS